MYRGDQLIGGPYPWKRADFSDEEGFARANFGPVYDRNGVAVKGFAENGLLTKSVKGMADMPGFNTTPVGTFAPGEYGLYDMAGNVSEWVTDTPTVLVWPIIRPIEKKPALLDPQLNLTRAEYFFSSAMWGFWDTIEKTPVKAQPVADSVRWNVYNNRIKDYKLNYCRYTLERDQKGRPLIDENGRSIVRSEFLYQRPFNEFVKFDSEGVIALCDTIYVVYRQLLGYERESQYEKSITEHNLNVLLRAGKEARVVKGGSWNDPPIYMYFSSKQAIRASETSAFVGFRLALDITPLR